jgi:hypothetical protein
MHAVWFIAITGSGAAVMIASFAVFQHRPARAVVVARVSEPRSLVQMLTTQAAIADAARRADSSNETPLHARTVEPNATNRWRRPR